MIERLPGIFEIELTAGGEVTDKVRIFLIPGKPGERSLMIDTGYNKPHCLREIDEALETLGIDCGSLDVFLTHIHHDHSGHAYVFAERGSRVFMNPQENRRHYDCLYYKRDQDDYSDQHQAVRSVGVTPEETPQLWDMFTEIRLRVENNKGWIFEVPDFDFFPIKAGQIFSYGDYCFEAIHLKGHTYGQMGLYEREKRIVFTADQIIDGIVPIVGTTYPDEHLLKGYFDSLEQFKHEYADCLLIPAHEEIIRDVKPVISRIVFAYLDKADMIKRILDHSRRKLTVREVACLAYGMKDLPGNMMELVKLKMVMSKSFSCLEYLLDEDFVIRTEENGIFYWQSAQRV